MRMKNTADHELRVPGAMLDDSEYAACGKALVKPRDTIVAAGEVVAVDPAYGCRRRGAFGGESPSIAYDLTGGMLQPHGPDAVREARLFVDQHPDVQLRQEVERTRVMRERPDLYKADPQEQKSETERLAMALGLRRLATAKELHVPEVARRVSAPPVAELSAGSPWDGDTIETSAPLDLD
jgi:hypothetical protein